MEFYRVALDLNTELSAFLMSEKNIPKKWRAVYTYPILALMESLFDYIEDANAIWPNSDELVAERKCLQKECINCVTKIYGKLQRAMREYGGVVSSRAAWREKIDALEAELETLTDE